jgi:ferric-chelate reductase
MALAPRHIQNLSEAASLEPHWGYADRAVPCTNDPGSCAYLDVVYSAHDRGMIYTGIFWATLGGILLVWALWRRIFPSPDIDDGHHHLLQLQLHSSSYSSEPESQHEQPLSVPPSSYFTRLRRAIASTTRHYLLPAAPLRPVFGHTTRLQLLLLAFLVSYLTLWSFIGIGYGRWVTPVKNSNPPVFNTRTSIGPWADRVGVLAYALTPLSILLASRENVLSLLTGLPYTSFMYLHRWTGYIILAQSLLHTLGWVLVEAWLYQPQPKVWNDWIAQEYAVWGVVALVLLVVLWVGTWRVTIRVAGYEAFRKGHYVLAMVYIGALIGHWKQLQCFLVPGLLLWGLDRGARLVRMGLLHYGYWQEKGGYGFRAVQAEVKVWEDRELGDAVRLDFDHVQAPWKVGQHMFLCFAEGSIWQSHPFTPLSLPVADATGRVRHSYIFRAKGGETRKIVDVVAKKKRDAAPSTTRLTTPVILQGPYGENILEGLAPDVNVLCVAGGTGITFVLPVLLRLVREQAVPGRKIELVWAVKRRQDLEWVEPEMDELRRLGAHHDIQIRTYVTAPDESLPVTSKEVKVTDEKGRSESEGDAESLQGITPSTRSGHDHRPDVAAAVDEFVGGVVRKSTRVYGSGPPGMIQDLRAAVSRCNCGTRVWKGEERYEVRLVCDDRLE